MKKLAAILLVASIVVVSVAVGGSLYIMNEKKSYIENFEMKNSNLTAPSNSTFLKESYSTLKTDEGDIINVTWAAYEINGNPLFGGPRIFFIFNANIYAENYIVSRGDNPSIKISIETNNNTPFDMFSYPQGVLFNGPTEYYNAYSTSQDRISVLTSKVNIKNISNLQSPVIVITNNYPECSVHYQMVVHLMENDGVKATTLGFNAYVSV